MNTITCDSCRKAVNADPVPPKEWVLLRKGVHGPDMHFCGPNCVIAFALDLRDEQLRSGVAS